MRFAFLVGSSALLAGCGYVGDPMPPALNIPVAVQDLRVKQRGDRLVLDFTAPALTTDDIGLVTISAAEVRIGEDAVQAAVPKPGMPAHIELPIRAWVGREVPIRVILAGPKGQQSRESNAITLRVAEPLGTPANVEAVSHPEGVQVRWTVADGRILQYRLHRIPESEAIVDKPEYIDRNVEAGKEYKYSVVALAGTAESVVSAEASVIPRDTFPPATPKNVTGIAGTSSVELAWDPNPEPDLKSYRVYRNGVVLAQDISAPSFSDKQIAAGQRYSYAVAAVDQKGNESAKSIAVEVSTP